MKTIRLNSFVIALLIPAFMLLGNNLPEKYLEGPFNHDLSKGFFNDEGMVPNTLYHNNKTPFVTVWDEATQHYITYDQYSGEKQPAVVFNALEVEGAKAKKTLVAAYERKLGRGGGRVAMLGNKVAPTTHLDAEGLKIQAEYGCQGCHTM